MFPYAYKLKKTSFNQRKKALEFCFCGILDLSAVQDVTKFQSLITNVLLQLVRDIIRARFFNKVNFW